MAITGDSRNSCAVSIINLLAKKMSREPDWDNPSKLAKLLHYGFKKLIEEHGKGPDVLLLLTFAASNRCTKTTEYDVLLNLGKLLTNYPIISTFKKQTVFKSHHEKRNNKGVVNQTMWYNKMQGHEGAELPRKQKDVLDIFFTASANEYTKDISPYVKGPTIRF